MAGTGTLGDTQAEAAQGVPRASVAEDPGAVERTLYAPKTNSALELAGALSELTPEVGQALHSYATVQQAKAEETTKAAAIAANGAGFAEAVRRGLIEPTQSPWIMRAYARNSAAVQTQNAVAQLNTDSATWAEQNDPGAFQKKYSKALGDIGKQYAGDPFAQEGYNAAAAPALQQAVAGNQAYNVQRIKTERQQDISSLAGKSLMDAIQQGGGKVTPDGAQKTLAPFKAEWLGTGGTITDWNKLVIGAIQDAAFRVRDPAVLELAKGIPNSAGGSLYDMEGSARDLTQTSYMIERENRDQIRLGMQQEQFQDYTRSRDIENALFSKFGPGVYNGQSDLSAAIPDLQQKGYNAPQIGSAFKSIAETANSLREIAADRISSFADSPNGANYINQLYGDASTKGWSPDLEHRIGLAVIAGDLSANTAEEVRGKAIAHTPKENQQIQSDIRQYVKANNDILSYINTSETIAHKHGARPLSSTEAADLEGSVRKAVLATAKADPINAATNAPLVANSAIMQWWTTWKANERRRSAPKAAQGATGGAPR